MCYTIPMAFETYFYDHNKRYKNLFGPAKKYILVGSPGVGHEYAKDDDERISLIKSAPFKDIYAETSVLSKSEGNYVSWLLSAFFEGDGSTTYVCAIYMSINGDNLTCAALCHQENIHGDVELCVYEGTVSIEKYISSGAGGFFIHIASNVIKRITQTVDVEVRDVKRKFKTKKKTFCNVREIVFISKTDKRYANNPNSRGGKRDFDYRFEVPGHWRTLRPNRPGKDKNGEYNQLGRTWVTNHVRGPDDKPIKKQTRIILGE